MRYCNYYFKANFERWCRLRGNLLFYLKSHDQLSDLLGVIVLQNYSVQLDESPPEGPFSFQIGKGNQFCSVNNVTNNKIL